MSFRTAAHTRVHVSLTAAAEKRLLVGIAARLPRRVTSDSLSTLGLAAMAAAGLSFAAFRWTPWAAAGVVVSLAANWFGDSLDGTVARVRHHERPRFGFYVDHVIDLAGTTLLMAGVACSGLMHPTLALAVLGAYLLVSAESYLTTHAAGVFRMSFLGFGPTELRIVLMIGALKGAASPWIHPVGGPDVRLFDLGGSVAAVGLLTAFVTAAIGNTRALHRAEPLPRPAACPAAADEGRMTRHLAVTRRPLAFFAVAAGGFLIQTTIVAVLTRRPWIPAELATAIGVELAVLHNFLWHERLTWADRLTGAPARIRRFVAYQLATGSTSLAGNVLVVSIAVHAFGMDATIASVLAVVAMSLANYAIADRWVFGRGAVAAGVVLAVLPGTVARGREAHEETNRRGRGERGEHFFSANSAVSAVAFPLEAAQPSADTIREWDAHIARLEAAGREGTGPTADPDRADGREVRVAGGVIHEWSGSVIIPGITVPQLIRALTTPGTPPPQEDVLEARVLGRSGDALRVYLKLQRTAIITVTYDTEHAVTFARHSPSLASSRSVATSIRETGGGDRGFLWRLNSYWTYREVDDGVRVDVLSVSLSRRVPALARPVVGPIAGRIARESMRRTLDAMRRFGLALTAPSISSREGFSRAADAAGLARAKQPRSTQSSQSPFLDCPRDEFRATSQCQALKPSDNVPKGKTSLRSQRALRLRSVALWL
jgi:archaetidylinositol phosphate synthase